MKSQYTTHLEGYIKDSPPKSAVTVLQMGESWCIFIHSKGVAQIFRRLRRAKSPAGLCPAPRWTPHPVTIIHAWSEPTVAAPRVGLAADAHKRLEMGK